jgi:hypothetical protein
MLVLNTSTQVNFHVCLQKHMHPKLCTNFNVYVIALQPVHKRYKFLTKSTKSIQIYSWLTEIDLKHTHTSTILPNNTNPFNQIVNKRRKGIRNPKKERMKQKQTQVNTAQKARNSNQILRVTRRELNPTDINSVKVKWVWWIRYGAEKLHQEETGKFFSQNGMNLNFLRSMNAEKGTRWGCCRVAESLRLFLNK